jgi:hypothetical protein
MTPHSNPLFLKSPLERKKNKKRLLHLHLQFRKNLVQ